MNKNVTKATFDSNANVIDIYKKYVDPEETKFADRDEVKMCYVLLLLLSEKTKWGFHLTLCLYKAYFLILFLF